MKEED